ncbi:MAG: hypothetical protein ACO3EP_04130 [Phycisphaerales bacterium]
MSDAATGALASGTEAAMSIPLGDWQFWVVSLIALAGVALVVRPLFASKSTTPACGGCAKSAPAKARHATLTIEGERPT